MLGYIRSIFSNRRCQGYHYRLTSAGWFFFALGFLLMLASISSGHNLLYLMVCVFLASFIVMGNVAAYSLKKLHVTRTIPTEVYAGSRTQISLTVHNQRHWTNSSSIVVRESPSPANDHSGVTFFDLIAPGQQGSRTYDILFPHRGWTDFHGLEILTRYPFGFWERAKICPLREQILVFPEILSTKFQQNWISRMNEQSDGHRPGRGTDLVNFREFQAGDPVHSVHWKNSAKLDRLLVAIYRLPDLPNLRVVFQQTFPLEWKDSLSSSFELAVSWVATMLIAARDNGIGFSYEDNSQVFQIEPHSPGWLEVMRHLSVIQPVFHPYLSAEGQQQRSTHSVSPELSVVSPTPQGLYVNGQLIIPGETTE